MKKLSNKWKPIILMALLSSLPLLYSCNPDGDPEVIPDSPSDESMFFPNPEPATWNTLNPDSLGWNTTKLNELNTYLKNKKTKGFIILKNGRIVVEEYYNLHNKNAKWNWYSAAKSLTSTMVGIAEAEGKMHLDSSTSTYLGEDWSALTDEREDSIKLKHHLSMSTGLKNPIGNWMEWTCIQPLCFMYQAPVNTRWAYHQGAFTLNQEMVSAATGTNFKQYCRTKIQDPLGMDGSWTNLLGANVFSSTTRSMARFGLLVLNKGTWKDTIVFPEDYYNRMIQPSQDMNKAYGYLWWLNGQEDFLGTQNQTVFQGSLVPNAPSDMFCALGAQDQKIYIIPSLDMVVVRCGEPAGNTEFASSSFDNELWGKLMDILP
jgi:CubicO group peptidase (beta-lactamase class C family)